MTHPLHTRPSAARRARRLLAVLALAPAAMASDCPGPESVDERSVVASIVPATRADTTYATDTLVYEGPAVMGASGVPLGNFEVRWESSRPDVARLLDPPVQRYAIGGLPSEPLTRPTMRVEVVRDGSATITMTPLDVRFVNDVPQRYTATVVANATRPAILDVQSSYTIRVGDTLTLAASPRGQAGGVVTSGRVAWSVADQGIARLYSASAADWGTTASAQASVTSGATGRVGLRGVAPGRTTIDVVYDGPSSVRLQRTVTVNVIPNAARVDIIRRSETVHVANDLISVSARLLDAEGRQVDPSAIRFTSREPVALAVRPGADGCPSSFIPGQCAAVVTPSEDEIVRRGGVARVWVVATAGPAAADSVQLTVYPAVALLGITPSATTLAVGGSVDLTVVAVDARGVPIPAAAFPSPFVIGGVEGATPFGVLQFSTTGKPPMVTNVLAAKLPPGGTGSVLVSAARLIGAGYIEARATITIRSVGRIVLTPASATQRLGGEPVKFTAQLLDGAGRPVTHHVRVDWSVADPAVAVAVTTVDGGALVQGVRVGKTEIVATAEGVTARAAFEVTAAPVAPTVAVTPASIQLQVGQTAALTAVVVNGAPGAAVEWATRDGAIAAITTSGGTATVRGAAAGETWVVASHAHPGGTARDSTRVRVTAAPTASRVRAILLEPRSAEVTAPASVAYRVSFYDATGARTTVEPGGALEFTSSRTDVAAVSAALGRATGVGAGTTTIRARYLLDGREVASDTAALLVYAPTPGHLGSVEISTSGNAREVRVGQDLLFQVIVRDVNGMQITANAAGLAVGPTASPYVEVIPEPGMGPGFFYRVRGKAPTPAPTAGDPLSGVVMLRADVVGAGASIPIVVRP